jgi:protein gp37
LSVKSAIEWTDATWNPVTGCTKVSPGCAHCYAEAITLRFARGGPYLPGKTTIKLHQSRLRLPLTWKSPKRIFVNSMSDLFHEEVRLEFIRALLHE